MLLSSFCNRRDSSGKIVFEDKRGTSKCGRLNVVVPTYLLNGILRKFGSDQPAVAYNTTVRLTNRCLIDFPALLQNTLIGAGTKVITNSVSRSTPGPSRRRRGGVCVDGWWVFQADYQSKSSEHYPTGPSKISQRNQGPKHSITYITGNSRSRTSRILRVHRPTAPWATGSWR